MNAWASWWSNGRRVAAMLFVSSPLALLASTNTWINPTGGRWDDANSWSLGLPNSSQSIEITNASSMSVVIDADTVQQNASSMTVSNLLVNSGNELIITNAGTNVSLQVLGSVSGYQNGYLLMYDSAFQAQNLSLIDTYQNGGVAQIGTMTLANSSSYTLSYGALQCNQADLITSPFYQYGGVANIGQINLYEGPYRLNGGLLFSSSIYLNGQMGGSTFFQQGGTNSTALLTVNAISRSDYYLTNGVINAGNLSVIVGYGTDSANFYQQGGTVFVTNSLSLQGAGYHYPWEGTSANYHISDGTLAANAIVFNGQVGPGSLDINNSALSAGSLIINGVTYAPGSLSLQSGTLRCGNVINNGGAVSISQSGGGFVVSNLFVFGGYYPIPLNGPTEPARYNFSGGTLAANNIEIDAEMVIGGSAQSGRISNPGYFRLAGILDVGNAHETLGQFILASQTVTNYEMPSASLVVRSLTNAVINFTGGNSVLAFADSHSIAWSNAATLSVVNWSGAPNGGGNQQLKFGTNTFGLTAGQLSQIRFVNPGGFPAGTYLAHILSTGEVVPYAPEVIYSRSGGSLILSWNDPAFVLQTATNVTGPYVDVPGATSPFANNLPVIGQRYFRLRYAPDAQQSELIVADLAWGTANSGEGHLFTFKLDGTRTIVASKLSNPRAVVVNSSNEVFVSDFYNGIWKYQVNGVSNQFAAFQPAINMWIGSGDHLFAQAPDLPRGNTYDIREFAPDGTVLSDNPQSGSVFPNYLAYDAAGNRYETDFDGGNIYKTAPDSTKTLFATGLDHPTGIALSPRRWPSP